MKDKYIQKKRSAKAYLCEQLVKKKKRSKKLSATKQKFEKSFPPIIKLIDMDGYGEKNCVRGTHIEVGEKVTSLKRKAEADTPQLRRYEKRRNYEFIKKSSWTA